jgi:hypothetical protein
MGGTRCLVHQTGRSLYLAEGHPTALVFDSSTGSSDGRPGYYVPYFLDGPLIYDDPRDYVDEAARLKNVRQYTFMHPIAGLSRHPHGAASEPA